MAQSDSALHLPEPGVVSVGNLHQARRHKRLFDAVITIEDPAAPYAKQLRFHMKPAPAHLVLKFEDVDEDGLDIWTAEEADVHHAVEFARAHAKGSLLVHCLHGIGRSGGIALAVVADRFGPGREEEALAEVLRVRPVAVPNRVVVAHADAVLGRSGALIAAVDRWEAATPHARQLRINKLEFLKRNPGLYAARPSRASTVVGRSDDGTDGTTFKC